VVPTVPASYSIAVDTALYGADKSTPVARLTAKNFLDNNTVVVPVQLDGDWALILTPSRQALPSTSNGNAPAQTAAWIRSSALILGPSLVDRVQVSVPSQTLTILDGNGAVVQQFKVGVGTPATPTPTGVTGYLQARYLDPTQGQSVYPIQLTTLHSSAADEPYGGDDGGLIGVHYEAVASGQVSHGCIRLNADAVAVVNALPLGTLISIVNTP
jgi:lipoprotein-anchoring transpeptidase ErfK/SrfK